MEWFYDNENWKPDLVIFRPPTTPFLSSVSITKMVQKINRRPDVNSIVTICKPWSHPFTIVEEGRDGLIKNGVIKIKGKSINDIERSQDWPTVWTGSAACRISKSSIFFNQSEMQIKKTYDIKSFIGHKISMLEGLDINNEIDFKLASIINDL